MIKKSPHSFMEPWKYPIAPSKVLSLTRNHLQYWLDLQFDTKWLQHKHISSQAWSSSILVTFLSLLQTCCFDVSLRFREIRKKFPRDVRQALAFIRQSWRLQHLVTNGVIMLDVMNNLFQYITTPPKKTKNKLPKAIKHDDIYVCIYYI